MNHQVHFLLLYCLVFFLIVLGWPKCSFIYESSWENTNELFDQSIIIIVYLVIKLAFSISISHLPVHFILISLYEADSLCICIRAFLNQSLCIWPREIHNQHFCVKYIIQGHPHATLKWLSADLLPSENYQNNFLWPHCMCVFLFHLF